MHDYLLTNQRLKPPTWVWRGLEPHVARVLWGVQPEFLQASLDAIDQDYGGLEAYLREGLGLGPGRARTLRALYGR